jgi:hypothetical protein
MPSHMKKPISMNLLTASHPSVTVSINTAFFPGTISNIYKQASMLAGFRQYVHYHCHASKCNLHARVINRIEQFYKVCRVVISVVGIG